MNRTHRTVWSRRLRAWVAVSEHARGAGKCGGGLVLAGALLLAAHPAGAQLPTGGQVSAGAATITQNSPSLMTIQQASARAAINWQGFSIGAGKAVQFVQPSPAAVALNRVTGGDPSVIQGALRANGQVFLINPNGVLFSPTAQVNVGALVATTRQLSDTAFLSPQRDPVTGQVSYAFSGGSTASVVNQGSITAGDRGFVALMGATVANEAGATIRAPGGSVVMGAAHALWLDMDANGAVSLRMDPAVVDTLLASGAATRDASGSLVLNAQGAQSVGAGVINQSGHVDATSLQADAQGRVMLLAPGGLVQHAGLTEASGARGGSIQVRADTLVDGGQWQATGSQGNGGSIDLALARHAEQIASAGMDASGTTAGGRVRVTAGESLWLSGRLAADSSLGVGGSVSTTATALTLAGARLSADGAAGGGTVRVGGGWQGGDADLANARKTGVGAGTQLSANATSDGNGGTVVVWSQERTLAGDAISARGAGSGHGGRVEVSSHGELGFSAQVDVGAPQGQAGSVLLDPANIVISDTPTGNLFPWYALADPAASAGNNFGSGGVLELADGRIVVSSPDYDLGPLVDAGSVRMYSREGVILSVMSGASAGDRIGSGGMHAVGSSLSNVVISSPLWNNGATTDVGAVTWFKGNATGLVPVSPLNSLVGTRAGDQVGKTVTVLSDGNYVVASPDWSNGTYSAVGAVTYRLGDRASAGVVSAANSLVGSNPYDAVGKGGVVALRDGAYVVASPDWAYGTSGNGAFTRIAPVVSDAGEITGADGTVSAANSLVSDKPNGTTPFAAPYVTALPDGNYVVTHSGHDESRGAVTWMNGTSRSIGLMSTAANVVGVNANDQIGSGGITGLTNGSFVILSPLFNGGRGSAKWVDGRSVSSTNPQSTHATNSATGTAVGDFDEARVQALSGSDTANYVITLPHYDPDGRVDAGVVAVYNGTNGRGAVLTDRYDIYISDPSSAIIGQTAYDRIGSGGIIQLVTPGESDPMFLILSPHFAGERGAITLANGRTNRLVLGNTLAYVASTSVVGSVAGDMLGSGGGVALDNGDALVLSPNWSLSAGGVVQRAKLGAATRILGTTSIGSGRARDGATVLTAANSLIGVSANDQFGSGGVFRLPNGQYFINAPLWNSGSLVDVGLVTKWGNGVAEVGDAAETSGYLGGADNARLRGGLLASARTSQEQASAPRMMLQTANNDPGGRQVSIIDFSFPTAANPALVPYSNLSASVTISRNDIQNLLHSGADVTLQASNDITVSKDVHTANGTSAPSADGDGDLTLQAGRSIHLNANLTTNGDVELIANDTAAHGVIASQRTPGLGGITMASTATLTARNVILRVLEGLAADSPTAGAITLSHVAASQLDIFHAGLLPSAGTFSIGTKVYDGTTAAPPGQFDLSGKLAGVLALTSGSSLGLPVVQGYSFASANATPAPTFLLNQSLALTGFSGGLRLSNHQGTALLLNGTGQITPRLLDVSGSRPYNGNGTFDAAQITLGNLLAADQGQVTWSGSLTVNGKDTGTYGFGNILQPSTLVLSTPNYALKPGSVAELQITARPIALSASKVYDGSGLFTASQVSVGNLVAGDLLSLGGWLTTQSANRGSYGVENTDASNLTVSNPNYALTAQSALNLSITPRMIGVNGFKLFDGNGVFVAGVLTPINVLPGDQIALAGSLTVTGHAPGVYGAGSVQVPGALATNPPNYEVTAASPVNLVIAPPTPVSGAEPAPEIGSSRENQAATRLPLTVRGTGVNVGGQQF